MLNEFKAFISRGNVLDLAVGVIVGGAFGKIVDALVGNMLMPIVGILLGGIDFTGLTLTFGAAELKYGVFIQRVFDFLIIAFVIFLIVRYTNRLTAPLVSPTSPPPPTPPPTPTEALLTEIRDAMKLQTAHLSQPAPAPQLAPVSQATSPPAPDKSK